MRILDSADVFAVVQHGLAADFFYLELINWGPNNRSELSAVDIRKGIY